MVLMKLYFTLFFLFRKIFVLTAISKSLSTTCYFKFKKDRSFLEMYKLCVCHVTN